MRLHVFFIVVFAAGCVADQRPPTIDSATAVAALRDSLIRIGIEDQAGRDSIGIALANKDSAFLHRMSSGDSARTRWLQSVIAARGWPRRSLVGEKAASTAWLIVQHSPMHEFQEEMLPLLTAEARKGEVNSGDVAMLEDRVLVHKGEKQRYGTQFSFKGDTLVADPIANLATLDSLRQSVGLPPMAEYVAMLAEGYRMRVLWPPRTP